MIGRFDSSGNRLAITYNSLTLNSPTDTREPTPQTYLVETVASQSAIDFILENKQQADGSEVYGPHKISRIISLQGRILAPSEAVLFDMIEDMATACDPALVAFKNPSDFFLALDYSTPTNDLTNYPTGLMACRYYAWPMKMPEPVMSSVAQGFGALFDLTFLMKDPRRYLQSSSSTTGTSIDNSLADYPSYPTLSFTMTGAGSATFSVRNAATTNDTTLTLDLSGRSNNDAVVVDFANRRITVNGSVNMGLYVSGDYFLIEPGTNTLTYTNTTNTGTRTMSWRKAFPV